MSPSVLTPEQIRRVLFLARTGEMTKTELARRLQVSLTTISKTIREAKCE